MRLFPILAAIAVTAFVYVAVFERDQLMAMMPSSAKTEADTPVTTEQSAAKTEAAQDSGPAPINVIAVKSRAQEVDSAVVLRGQTEAARQVETRAETSGRMISTPLRKGAFVTEGQILCELDPGTRGASLAEAKARLAEAQSRLPEARARAPEADARIAESQAVLEQARAVLDEANINVNAARELVKNGYASETRLANAEAAVRGAEAGITSAQAAVKSAQSGLETVASGISAAEAGIEAARAGVAAAEKEIERLTVKAPFAGLLESDTAELGSLLQPGSLCATILQLDPIKLVGFVPETEISRIALGAPGGGRLADGNVVQGTVGFLSRSADPQTRTFRVEIDVPNPELTLRDGQTAEILIGSEGQKAHLLPQSVLTLDDSGTLGVRAIDSDSKAVFYPVTLLRDTREGIWITGLPDEADVIVIGQEFVVEGVSVAPSYEGIGQ